MDLDVNRFRRHNATKRTSPCCFRASGPENWSCCWCLPFRHKSHFQIHKNGPQRAPRVYTQTLKTQVGDRRAPKVAVYIKPLASAQAGGCALTTPCNMSLPPWPCPCHPPKPPAGARAVAVHVHAQLVDTAERQAAAVKHRLPCRCGLRLDDAAAGGGVRRRVILARSGEGWEKDATRTDDRLLFPVTRMQRASSRGMLMPVCVCVASPPVPAALYNTHTLQPSRFH